jgi:tetratricopeptide (TPR) repeat protein
VATVPDARPRYRLLYALGIAAVLAGVLIAIQSKPIIASSAQSQSRAHTTIAPEAYDAYLKGRYFWNKRTENGLLKSVGYLQKAVAKSPGYARAWAALADSDLLLGEFRMRPREQAFVNAKNAIDKALALDNDLGEAHATLAALESDKDQWGLAEPEFRRALQLSPGYATAHQWYAEGLAAHGRTSEALTEIRQANQIDPLSLTVNVQVGYILFLARRYDQAIAQLRTAIDMDPYFGLAYAVLGHAYEQKGMYAEAIAELRKSADLSQDPGQTVWLAHARALAGQKAEARRARAALEESGDAPALPMALLDLALGDRNQALARLEGACSAGPIEPLSPTPIYDPLRADPQIAALLARCASSRTWPLLSASATSTRKPAW